MIARITTLGLRVGFCLALEVGACDVVEQYFVLDRKQLSAALRQMRFEGSLVRKEAIEAAVKTIFVDLFTPELQQIGKRRASVPILRNVQLARWLAEPGHHQHGRHLRPCNALLSNRQKPPLFDDGSEHLTVPVRLKGVRVERSHQFGDVYLALALWRGTGLEDLCERLLWSTDQSARKSPRLNTSVLIELAKMRHRLLDDASPDTHATHQAPIAVDFPVLSSTSSRSVP